MVRLLRPIQYSLLKKVTVCLVFIGLLITNAQAQLGGPPHIIVQPLGVGVLNGGTAILTSTATSLTSMELQWYYNGKKLAKNAGTVLNVVVPLVGTVSTLTIPSVNSSVAGTYYLKAENIIGSATSSNATVILVVPVVSNVVNFVSSATGMTTNGFRINLSGPTGSNVVVQASSDLINWTSISTNTVSGGNVSYTDTTASSRPGRYYRAYIQ